MVSAYIYSEYIIEGKWQKHKYKLLKLLGEGGIGKVYKAKELESNKIYAIKLSDDLHSITKEYETLKKFNNIKLLPSIVEIDDTTIAGNRVHYIVMEYIVGQNLREYLETNELKIKDILGLAIIIGNTFAFLHENQYIFGDLKLENLMLDKENKILRIIDFGGVTLIGRGIIEYTPLYDRATWNEGLRRADENYDLFSLNMFIANLLDNNTLTTQVNSVENLIKKLQSVDISSSLLKLIHKGLKGKITFPQYLNELKHIYVTDCYLLSTKKNFLDNIINYVMIFSIMLFITIITVFLGKSI